MSVGAAAGAAAARRVERRLVEHLKEVGAVNPASACPIPDQRWMGKRVLARLIAAGAVRETAPGYYLDEEIYDAYRARRKRNTIAVLGIVAVAASLVIWFVLDKTSTP